MPAPAAPPQVDFGVFIPQLAMSYEDLLARALTCESVGLDSLWLMDHLYPPELPDQPSLEAWTTATALLAQTTSLRVGHLVLAATFRHPALLAKMATTLDVVSGGRLELGIGSGSYPPEHHRAGIEWGSFRERSELLEETLAVLTGMFEQPETSYAGRHFTVSDLPNLPPPVQRPRPPIHVGGAGEKYTLPLVARYADVWNCPTYALGEFEAKRAALTRECEKIGRDPGDIRISQEAVMVLVEDRADVEKAKATAERRFGGEGWGLHEGGFIGTPDDVAERIEENIARGVTFFVFFTHDRGKPETLHLLAEQVMPRFRTLSP